MAKKKRKSSSILTNVIHGKVLSSDIFTRHWLFITTLMGVIVLYITDKYENQTSMEEIRRLNTELEIAKTECVRERSEFMSRTRESSMQALVDSLKLGLHVQNRPPFKLNSKD